MLVRAGAERVNAHTAPIVGAPPAAPASAPTDVGARAGTGAFRAVEGDADEADAIRDLALMRLAAREAYERLTVTLLETLARDVLARELALEPVAIDALVRAVLADAATNEPVAIAVARADVDRVRADIPVRVDDALAPGDLVVEVREGAFSSTFAFRLEGALARVADDVRR